MQCAPAETFTNPVLAYNPSAHLSAKPFCIFFRDEIFITAILLRSHYTPI